MTRARDMNDFRSLGGVERRRIGDLVVNFDRHRKPVTRSARNPGEYPYYGANGIQDYVSDYLFDGTFLLVGEDGSVKTGAGRPVVNWADGKIWVNNHAHIMQSKSDDVIDLRFLYYVLQTVDIAPYITGGTQPKLNQANMNMIEVPVPPIVVQREIVRTLDTFTELEAELGAELGAELEARTVQYEHYRFEILERVNAPFVSLVHLGQWRGGITPSKSNPRYWESGTIPWLTSMDVSASAGREIRGRVTEAALRDTPLRVIPGPAVVVVMRSNILRRVLPIGFVANDFTVNQDIRALVPKHGIKAEYVYQALKAASERIRAMCVRTDRSMAAVDTGAFMDFQIPVPSLVEQAGIADKLRNFEVRVSDLGVGLSAELAARRRQYEYYRDRLLSFEGAPS